MIQVETVLLADHAKIATHKVGKTKSSSYSPFQRANAKGKLACMTVKAGTVAKAVPT